LSEQDIKDCGGIIYSNLGTDASTVKEISIPVQQKEVTTTQMVQEDTNTTKQEKSGVKANTKITEVKNFVVGVAISDGTQRKSLN
jgi:hypothetical protein